jgi:hypothetical protein
MLWIKDRPCVYYDRRRPRAGRRETLRPLAESGEGEKNVMEPIRTPFYVGLIGLVAGLLMLGAWFYIEQPPTPTGVFLYALFYWFALLVASAGGFLAFCTGAVFLVNLLVEPRIKKKPGRA